MEGEGFGDLQIWPTNKFIMWPYKRQALQQLVQFLDLSWRDRTLIGQQLVSKLLVAVLLLGAQQRDIRDRLFLGFHGKLVELFKSIGKSWNIALRIGLAVLSCKISAADTVQDVCAGAVTFSALEPPLFS